ncbi:MAG: hypothetical protein A2X49_00245 [Lentisphaerae bacterium GWF2_52_8]|nr:MAG: hypothetical protein A2X49_00245 [Lentisphaerae bacterium GWF2_52_8]
MKIPHSRPYLDAFDEKALAAVLHDRYLSAGPRSSSFAEKVSRLIGRKWGIATSSGTEALIAALRLLGRSKGGRVAVPAYICSAVLDAVVAAGHEPVPVDIDRQTLAISPDACNVLGSQISLAVGAHLFGIPAPLHEIRVPLIEDCAQTLGASISNRQVGSSGVLSICSFYATKLLTTGHGGLLAGDANALRERARSLFAHDTRVRWTGPCLHGLMSDLDAALGSSQLAKLPQFLEERHKIAMRFTKALTGHERLAPGCIYSRFLIIVRDAALEEMISKFADAEIEAKRPVFKPLYAYLDRPDSEFPNAAWAHKHILSVPCYPGLSEDELSRIENFFEVHSDELDCWSSA